MCLLLADWLRNSTTSSLSIALQYLGDGILDEIRACLDGVGVADGDLSQLFRDPSAHGSIYLLLPSGLLLRPRHVRTLPDDIEPCFLDGVGTTASDELSNRLACEWVEVPHLVPEDIGEQLAELGGEQRAVLIAGVAELAAGTDLVVIDTGAGLGRGVRSFLNIADQVLIIATPEPTSIADAYALIKCVLTRPGSELIEDRIGLSGRPARVPISLIVNQVAGVQEARKVHTRIASVCARFLSYPLPMAGWISQDVRVGRSVRARCPLLLNSPNCSAAKDLRRIAAEIGAARVREPARAGRLSALVRWTGLGV